VSRDSLPPAINKVVEPNTVIREEIYGCARPVVYTLLPHERLQDHTNGSKIQDDGAFTHPFSLGTKVCPAMDVYSLGSGYIPRYTDIQETLHDAPNIR
jgi:hypothetical protein